jgi:hypothetical protein
VGALTPDRQAPAVPQTPVTTQVHQALDIHGNFPPEVTFNFTGMVNRLADVGDLGIRQFPRLGAGVNLGFQKHPDRAGAANAENIGKGDLNSLVPGQIDPCDSGQFFASLLTLALLVFRIFADHPHNPFAANNLTLNAHLFY